ncbi:MAG TPA: DUF542 domain-containing protein [Chryseosolibacter sp.]
MKIDVEDTISHIIDGNLTAAKILAGYQIDFCTEGHKTLKDACRDAGVPARRLVEKIKAAEQSHEQLTAVASMRIDELTRFLEKHYHSSTSESIAFIKTNLARVVRVHGRKHPEQEQVNRTFAALTARLTVQMQHEAFILFPYIREMVKKGKRINTSIYRSAKSPIREMISDHPAQDESLRKLDDLTHHYHVPADCSCNAFRITYAAMKDLEKELRMYRSLEDDFLFPRALEMEARFNMATWEVHC